MKLLWILLCGLTFREAKDTEWSLPWASRNRLHVLCQAKLVWWQVNNQSTLFLIYSSSPLTVIKGLNLDISLQPISVNSNSIEPLNHPSPELHFKYIYLQILLFPLITIAHLSYRSAPWALLYQIYCLCQHFLFICGFSLWVSIVETTTDTSILVVISFLIRIF